MTKKLNRTTGQVQGLRIMVLPLDNDEFVEETLPETTAVIMGTEDKMSSINIIKKKGSNLILPDSAVKAMKDEMATSLMRCLVISVGHGCGKDIPDKDKIKPADIVMAFPTTFEADIVLNGQRYLIYPERNILYKE